MRRAAPPQEFQFFIFERIGGLEKLLQFLDCPCRKAPHILQIALERRTLGHRENSVVPFFRTVGDLQDFEYADRFAAEHQAGVSRSVVDHKNIDRVTVLRLGGRDETPIVRIRQSDKQWFCQSEGTELCIELQRLPRGVSTTA